MHNSIKYIVHRYRKVQQYLMVYTIQQTLPRKPQTKNRWGRLETIVSSTSAKLARQRQIRPNQSLQWHCIKKAGLQTERWAADRQTCTQTK